MALYSLSATPIGGAKTEARSCASAFCAYVEREAEYAAKGGHVTSFVLLPEGAPEEWRDPHILWAAVDEIEGTTGHAATEYRGALANEISLEQNIEAILGWTKDHVEEGRCVHVAIHESPVRPGEYHFHILETVRGIDKDGKWINKRETFYPVRKGNDEVTIPASDWKAMKELGWEKIYPFKDGVNRTKSEAQAEGLSWKEDRKSQKPLQEDVRTNDWGSKSKLYLYRETWANELNNVLAKYAPEVEPVDHRSYIDRNIDKVPQVKMGWHATKAERDEQARCEREGDFYEPITVNGAKNAEIATINEKLAEKALPEEAREELLDRGYELRDMSFENAEQVRDHVKPLFEYVRQAVIKHVRSIIDRVLELPIVRTFRSFAQQAEKRGVEVSGIRSELSYSCAGHSFRASELGSGYERENVRELFKAEAKKLRKLAQSEESRKRVCAETTIGGSIEHVEHEDLESLISRAKDRNQSRLDSEIAAAIAASKDMAAHNPSTFGSTRGVDTQVPQNSSESRNKNKGHSGPGDDGAI